VLKIGLFDARVKIPMNVPSCYKNCLMIGV
jgi:hypothetical protein